MNPYVILGIVLGVTALTFLLTFVAIPYAIKKGYPIEKYLSTADKGIDIAKDVIGTVSKVVPIPYIEIIDKILVYADKGVASAEQLYKIGQIEKDARKSEAHAYVIEMLKLVDVEVTPEIEKIIDGAIEAGVQGLPKTHQ